MNEFSLETVALAFACLSFVVGGVFLVRRLRVVFGAESVNRFEAAPFDYVERAAASEPPRTVSETPRNTTPAPVTQQAEAVTKQEIETPAPTPEVTISSHLNKTELITLLAVQKKPDGDYTYSANQIRNFVGGTAADVHALIAELRGTRKDEPKAHAKGERIARPPEGWPA